MSRPGVKCIFCGVFIHERGVTSHLRSYHQISSLFLPGPCFNDAQTQIETGDRNFIYRGKSGEDLDKTPEITAAVHSSSETTRDSTNQYPEAIIACEEALEDSEEKDRDVSFERFRCPGAECQFNSATSESVEKHIFERHKSTKRQSRLSLKRNIETSPIKQTMSLMIDPVRVPRDIAATSARGLSSSPGTSGTGTGMSSGTIVTTSCTSGEALASSSIMRRSTLKRTKPFTSSRAPDNISDEPLSNCADEASNPKEPRQKKLKRTESERRSSPRHNVASQDSHAHQTRVLRSGGVGRHKPVTKGKKRGKSGKKMPRKRVNLDSSNKQCDTISKTSSENQTAINFPKRRRGRRKKNMKTSKSSPDKENIPAMADSDVTEKSLQMSKRRRGRPRKNPVLSALPASDNAVNMEEDHDCIILEEVINTNNVQKLSEAEQLELRQILETCANSDENLPQDQDPLSSASVVSDVSLSSLNLRVSSVSPASSHVASKILTPPPGPSRPYQCAQCPAKFDSFEELGHHLTSCAGMDHNNTDSSSHVTSSGVTSSNTWPQPLSGLSHVSIKTDNVSSIKSHVQNVYVRFVQTYYSSYKRKFPHLTSTDLIQKLKEGYKLLRESDHVSIKNLEMEYNKARREILNGKIKTIVKSLEEDGCANFKINV